MTNVGCASLETAEGEGGLEGKGGQAQFYMEDSGINLQTVREDYSMDSVSNKLESQFHIHVATFQLGLLAIHRIMGYTRRTSNVKKYISPLTSPISIKARGGEE